MTVKTLKKRKISKVNVYSKKDYESNDGMLTKIWGPSMWHCLHTISFNYPVKPSKKEMIKYMEFILNLKYVLPCGKCRKNLEKNFSILPLKMEDMASREKFSKYIYNLHEVVNKMLNKKSNLTYNEVRERYEHFRARCIKSKKNKSKKNTLKKNEKGCVVPLYGEKSKCILHIVPEKKDCNTFLIDNQCIKKRLILD
jgi:hypothetical protein